MAILIRNTFVHIAETEAAATETFQARRPRAETTPTAAAWRDIAARPMSVTSTRKLSKCFGASMDEVLHVEESTDDSAAEETEVDMSAQSDHSHESDDFDEELEEAFPVMTYCRTLDGFDSPAVRRHASFRLSLQIEEEPDEAFLPVTHLRTQDPFDSPMAWQCDTGRRGAAWFAASNLRQDPQGDTMLIEEFRSLIPCERPDALEIVEAELGDDELDGGVVGITHLRTWNLFDSPVAAQVGEHALGKRFSIADAMQMTDDDKCTTPTGCNPQVVPACVDDAPESQDTVQGELCGQFSPQALDDAARAGLAASAGRRLVDLSAEFSVERPRESEVKREEAVAAERVQQQEQRTTVMMRNLPNNYTREMLLALLDEAGFAGRYNFIYFPIDFRTHAALGYCFLNMVTSEDAEALFRRFDGFGSWSIPSRKRCVVSWSEPRQGLETYIARYRNSPLMHASVPDSYRPVLFSDGLRVPFPAPTKKIKPPRQGTEKMFA